MARARSTPTLPLKLFTVIDSARDSFVLQIESHFCNFNASCDTIGAGVGDAAPVDVGAEVEDVDPPVVVVEGCDLGAAAVDTPPLVGVPGAGLCD